MLINAKKLSILFVSNDINNPELYDGKKIIDHIVLFE
jgi:hypothetical protein